jgi:hypothetical protein
MIAFVDPSLTSTVVVVAGALGAGVVLSLFFLRDALRDARAESSARGNLFRVGRVRPRPGAEGCG